MKKQTQNKSLRIESSVPFHSAHDCLYIFKWNARIKPIYHHKTSFRDSGAYHCPADNVRKSIYDQTTVFVSYGVPMCLYGYPNPGSARYNTQIKTFGEITRPSTRYVFVESAETRNWNSSHHFVIGAPEYTNLAEWGWWGPMAVNHGDSSVLGFCDGHSEVRKWRDRFTIERVDKLITQGVTTYGIEYPPEGQTLDIDYMASGWAYRHRGSR